MEGPRVGSNLPKARFSCNIPPFPICYLRTQADDAPSVFTRSVPDVVEPVSYQAECSPPGSPSRGLDVMIATSHSSKPERSQPPHHREPGLRHGAAGGCGQCAHRHGVTASRYGTVTALDEGSKLSAFNSKPVESPGACQTTRLRLPPK